MLLRTGLILLLVLLQLQPWLKKDELSGECEESFEKLKHALVSAPVLAYPKFGPGNGFILETDASSIVLGAVLSQMQDGCTIHQVAYASHSIGKHEKNYRISELETLPPIHLGPPLHHLYRSCSIYLDCQTFQKTCKMGPHNPGSSIKHKAGKKNVNADALSRC